MRGLELGRRLPAGLLHASRKYWISSRLNTIAFIDTAVCVHDIKNVGGLSDVGEEVGFVGGGKW